MTADSKRVMDAALALPPDDRAELAEQLIRSLDENHQADLEAAWHTEIEHRLDEIDRGGVALIPADEAIRLLRQRMKP